jgi:hypothetical protein
VARSNGSAKGPFAVAAGLRLDIVMKLPCDGRANVLRSSLAACIGLIVTAAASSGRAAPPPRGVHIEMKNVVLHVGAGVTLDVPYLRGLMISRTPGAPPVFDDQKSYVLELEEASVSMSMESLQALMRNHVFNYDGAPLKDIKVEADGDRVKMSGKMHKGVDVPFSSKASVSASPDGRMMMKTESMKALGIPSKGLLDLFGLKLDDLVNLKDRRGIEIDGNNILIAPGQVMPPPEMRGKLARVTLDRGRLMQVFDDGDGKKPAALTLPSPSSKNYIYFSGGDIRFGKLTMHGADLQLIDADAKDPFDFDPAKYNQQLVAGYSKNTPSGGLKTYMPDFNDLRRPR